MTNNKTHWKKISNPNYLGSWDIPPGSSYVVTIVSVSQEPVMGLDGKAEQCVVAKISGHKPMILNATNKRAITKALGSPYIEDWENKRVSLHITKIKAFGEIVDAIRVSPSPVLLPSLVKTHEKWGAVVAAVAGGMARKDVETKFVVSDSIWEQLKNGK